jgi:membrane protein YdbS with pleckstrin-like domain
MAIQETKRAVDRRLMMLPGTTLRKSPFVFLKRLIVIEFFFALLPFVVAWLLSLDQTYQETEIAASISFPVLTTIVLTSLQVFIVAGAFITWYLPAYYFDEREIIYRRANLVEDRRLVDLLTVASVTVHQGPLGRRLNYGNLNLDAGGQKPVKLREISDPDRYAGLLAEQVERIAPPPAANALPASLTAPVALSELIAGGENQTVEFKSSLVWDYHQQRANKALYKPVYKNVVAFLNSGGGRLLIGVADDGQILGLEPDLSTLPKGNVDGFENVFNQAFNNMIGVEFRQFVTLSFPQIEELTVCLIEVRQGDEPAYLRLKGDEQFYIRAGNATQPLPISKATRYIQNHFPD